MIVGSDISGPGSMGELADLIADHDGLIAYIAGGTDLIIKMNEGWAAPDLLIDISRLEELSYVRTAGDHVAIGAATSLERIIQDPALRRNFGCLVQAADQFGSKQIQNRATIGGNIAGAAPGGDMLPVLQCLGARVSIIGKDRTAKTVAFEDVVTGVGQTILENGDLISEIQVPFLGDDYITGFEKLGRRTFLTIARLSLVAAVKFDKTTRTIENASLVAGAIGTTPLRLSATEALLNGRAVDHELAADFTDMLANEVDRAIPGRHSQPYKRQAIKGLGLNMLESLFGETFELAGTQA